MLTETLLTSFATWRPDQPSNASDDLLVEILDRIPVPDTFRVLRQLPVDFHLAPTQAITHITALEPEWIVCCGMAESRHQLNVERQATCGHHTLTTNVDLNTLTQNLEQTAISCDAGQFVCNHLYYSVLSHLENQKLSSQCIFVHVPILTPGNKESILTDFLILLQRIGALAHP
jgi:pyroglutamyl-peptidase